MEELMDRIIIDPEIMVGKPVIKGTRITVNLIIQLLSERGYGNPDIRRLSRPKERGHKSRAVVRV